MGLTYSLGERDKKFREFSCGKYHEKRAVGKLARRIDKSYVGGSNSGSFLTAGFSIIGA
jgi:hypothetical protein